ncbi:MAG: methyltransferase domain-containing protein [Bacteroidetes bacterium]|nr:MAG: methyltransferase domain-containing protein [Bacteroidota bacterium]
MRIIGGKFRGRRFTPPADKWPTRPTTDFAKEALFNILNNRLDFESVKMLDLFGGTGSHCYEFISRGCLDATYVDKFPPAVQFVRKLAQQLDIESCLKIFQMDVFRFIDFTTEQYDYIFAGPPYALPTIDIIPDRIFEKNLLTPDGLLVLEHNPNHDFIEHPYLVEVRHYGKTYFSFFQKLPESQSVDD